MTRRISQLAMGRLVKGMQVTADFAARVQEKGARIRRRISRVSIPQSAHGAGMTLRRARRPLKLFVSSEKIAPGSDKAILSLRQNHRPIHASRTDLEPASTGPVHDHFSHARIVPQSKRQRRSRLRHIAHCRCHRLRPHATGGVNLNPRPTRLPCGTSGNELNLQPRQAAPLIISQEPGRAIILRDHHVQITILIEISSRDAPRRCQNGPAFV